MSVKQRRDIEERIAGKVIDAALAAGYSITVNDGEEDTLIRSTRKHLVLDAMFSTDWDFLKLCKDEAQVGWIHFVYGNAGYDVISDYTLSLKELIKPVERWIDVEFTLG